jgi:glycosyltransferase 2 family protein
MPNTGGPERPKSKRGQMILRAFMVALVALSFLFVFSQIRQGWPELAAQSFRISFSKLALSSVCLAINFLLTAWAWAVIIEDMDAPISIAKSFAIIFFGQIGRYIPGKIWIVLGQAALAQQLGYRKSTAVAAGILHLFCGVLGATVVLALTVLLMGERLWIAPVSFALGAAGLLALLFLPARIERWINGIRERKEREPIRLTVRRATILKVYVFMILSWIVNCLAFVFLVLSMFPVGLQASFELAFAYNFSYWLGFAILFLPGGLGVRESAITFLLSPLLGPAMAGLIALVQRFWSLLAEILSFVIAIVIARFAVKNRETSGPKG